VSSTTSSLLLLTWLAKPNSASSSCGAFGSFGETLQEAFDKIMELRKRYENISIQDQGRRFNTDLLEAVELGFLLDLAEVTVITCRERRESRGAHLREDFPDRDDKKFMVHSMAYKTEKTDKATGTNIKLGWKPVVITNYQPMERKY